MFPRINKPYVACVAVVGTAGLIFIGWAITAQVYQEWSQGVPISGGWNWPIVFGVNLACLALLAGLYWKIYADSRTIIDGSGVSRPTLRGVRKIVWRDVTAIKVFGGAGFHIYAGHRKIVISPYDYVQPESVIESLQKHTAPYLSQGAA